MDSAAPLGTWAQHRAFLASVFLTTAQLMDVQEEYFLSGL